MPGLPNYIEWQPAKPRSDQDASEASSRRDDLATLFDEEIRRRFGEIISRAVLNSKKLGCC